MVRGLAGTGPAYCIDAFEFPGKNQLPRTGVTRAQAAALCAERGARLCSKKEWESACRGRGNASFPYGSIYDPLTCNTAPGTVKPSGASSTCRSGVGAYDMSGNVAEWIDAGTVRGGAVGEGAKTTRCSIDTRATKPSSTIGFRCCVGLP